MEIKESKNKPRRRRREGEGRIYQWLVIREIKVKCVGEEVKGREKWKVKQTDRHVYKGGSQHLSRGGETLQTRVERGNKGKPS